MIHARYANTRSGGGGLLSTVEDYARFLKMLANGGNSTASAI